MGTLIPNFCDQMTAQPSNTLVDQIRQKTAPDLLTTRWEFLLGGPDKARHLAVQKNLKSVVVSLRCHNHNLKNLKNQKSNPNKCRVISAVSSKM